MSEPILVTGGAGFIGSHLVERLLSEGREVYVVDDLSTGRLDNLEAVRKHPNLHLAVDSILNWPMMNEVVSHVEEVIHLAAAVGVRKIIDEPVETINTNVRGTEIVLDVCHKHGRKVFIASTSEIYGKAGEALDEDHDRVLGSTTLRRWAYACTKTLDEFLALAFHDEKDLPVVIGRFFNTVGPRQAGQWGMVLPNFVRQAVRNDPIRVFGSGEQRRCFLHVHDAVDAVLRLMRSDEAVGRVFNIGSEQEITIGGLARLVRERAGSSSPIETVSYEEAYGAGFEDMDRRQPDIGRIRSVVGWEPTLSLETIVDETIGFYRDAVAGAA